MTKILRQLFYFIVHLSWCYNFKQPCIMTDFVCGRERESERVSERVSESVSVCVGERECLLVRMQVPDQEPIAWLVFCEMSYQLSGCSKVLTFFYQMKYNSSKVSGCGSECQASDSFPSGREFKSHWEISTPGSPGGILIKRFVAPNLLKAIRLSSSTTLAVISI